MDAGRATDPARTQARSGQRRPVIERRRRIHHLPPYRASSLPEAVAPRRADQKDFEMTPHAPSSLATRRLGRASVQVTELGLGTAPLGENSDIIEEDEARALLAAAWDGG